MNEVIDDEKDTNNEIFLNYLRYPNALFLVKDKNKNKQDKNEKLENNIVNGLIDLRNDINRKSEKCYQYC